MHTTYVKLKDGTRTSGILWVFRPTEGWFELAGREEGNVKVRFADCESVTTEGVRVRADLIADQDELERARENGWDGT
jgi:hypothetical protein